MTIEIRMEGFEETQEYLDGVIERLSSDEFWDEKLGSLIKGAQRYAISISPVVTGSYRDAHRTVVGNMEALLEIDPAARNSRTGIQVSRYAADVEDRHQVYGRTAIHTDQLVAKALPDIGEELISEY